MPQFEMYDEKGDINMYLRSQLVSCVDSTYEDELLTQLFLCLLKYILFMLGLACLNFFNSNIGFFDLLLFIPRFIIYMLIL